MSDFIEEDGTGVTDATSYVSVTFSESYLGADWAADETAKQAALITASEYCDARWGDRLGGMPLTLTQGLQMPRRNLINRYGQLVSGIPNDWKKACCLYAAKSISGTLYPVSLSSSSKEIKSKETTVGPITTKVEYEGTPDSTTFLMFPLADRLAKSGAAINLTTRVIV